MDAAGRGEWAQGGWTHFQNRGGQGVRIRRRRDGAEDEDGELRRRRAYKLAASTGARPGRGRASDDELRRGYQARYDASCSFGACP
jgi:hypothetical protein